MQVRLQELCDGSASANAVLCVFAIWRDPQLQRLGKVAEALQRPGRLTVFCRSAVRR